MSIATEKQGTVFALGMPPPIDNPRWQEFERVFAPNANELWEHKRLAKAICSELNLGPGSKVLEIGAGVGLVAFELASRGVEVYDLDIVPANVELVNHVARHFGLDVTAIYGDSCYLPFADGQFDAVFSKSVFEHIHDQPAGLDEQIRVLKPGGRFMTLDGNLLNPLTLVDLIFRRPKLTKGEQGGLGWLFRKSKSRSDYGMGWLGKEEDIKTIWWWRRQVRKRPNVIPVKITTTRNYFYPNKLIYKILKPIIGMIVVVIEKAA